MPDAEQVRAAVDRLRRGDIGGLETLMLHYQVRALRAAHLISRDPALAEDVVQEAFLRAYERIEQFDAARPFGPWFLRVVVNIAVKAATRQRRQVPLPWPAAGGREAPADLADTRPGPVEIVEQAESARALWAALGHLSPAQRAAVVQRYYLGLGEAEAAVATGCPPGTIKWRLHAARARLRELLQARWAAGPGMGPPN